MTENLSLAQPYAKALFDLAREENKFSEWQLGLQFLAQIVVDPNVQAILKDPSVPMNKVSEFFYEILPSELLDEEKMQRQLQNFIKLLAENKRITLLPAIVSLFQHLTREHQQLRKVEVISAFQLNNKQRESLATALQARFQANIEIEYKLDTSLIGGMMIRSGNWVMDGSVKSKLQRLHKQLLAAC